MFTTTNNVFSDTSSSTGNSNNRCSYTVAAAKQLPTARVLELRLSARLAPKRLELRPERCLPRGPGGSASCYWNRYGTRCSHPAQ